MLFYMKTSVSKLFVFYEANKTEICRKPNDCQICMKNVRKVRLVTSNPSEMIWKRNKKEENNES